MLFILVSCLLISLTFSQQSCTLYTCDVKSEFCASQSKDATSGVLTYKMNNILCDQGSQFCSYTEATIDKGVGCKTYPSPPMKKYPGQSCNSSDLCLSGNCNNTTNLCVGNDTCSKNSDCNVGKYCNSGACVDLVAVGQPCKDHFDCVLNSGCNNNKCTPFYSIDDGTTPITPTKWDDVSFCLSGQSDPKTNTCVSYLNIEDRTKPCTTTRKCTYKEKYSTKETLNDPNKCKCGKNSYGDSYCESGNGQPEYKAYIDQYKTYLTSVANYSCHTLERYSCPYADANEKAINSLENIKVLATAFHEVQNATQCVTDVAYNYYYQYLGPVAPTCPVYSCKKMATENNCIESTYNATSQKSIVNSASCKNKSQICDFSLWDQFLPNNSVACSSNPRMDKYSYPGEKCVNYTKDVSSCKYDKTCLTNGFCDGAGENKACTQDYECLVGLWCNKTNPLNQTCARQLSKGAKNCTSDFECQNSQGCLSNVCTDYYSQPLGTPINVTKFSEAMCLSGKVDNNNKCDGSVYTQEMTKELDSKLGFVPCTISEGGRNYCEYQSYLTPTTKETARKCECPKSAKGVSRCPKAYDEKDSNWKYYAQYRREMMSVPFCHTYNRQECKSPETNSKYYKFWYKTLTKEAHLYADSEQCVMEIFGSSNIFKVSFLALVAFIIHLV